MKLLITTTTGHFAQGIRQPANAFFAAGHHVSVVCPDRDACYWPRPHSHQTHPRRNTTHFFSPSLGLFWGLLPTA